MPPFPGEETLATIYADIHYYFTQPTARPALHRFDKASYFYIYHNPTRHSSRLEIANNPGTPEQDAFYGWLTSCRIINSQTFPTLLTIRVDGADTASSTPSSAHSGSDPEEWRLASADPRDTGKIKCRLHTLDVYLWAAEDAKLVVNTLRRLLQPSQLDVPAMQTSRSGQEDTLSPVVQNLENVAISDPAYQNGRTRNSQNVPQGQRDAHLPPPPPAPLSTAQTTQASYHPSIAGSSISTRSSNDAHVSGKPSVAATKFAPLAYNPAAPAAPEPIAYREDTPPPLDGPEGSHLAAAARQDQDYHHQRHSSQPWTGIPPPSAASQSNVYGHAGSPHTASASNMSSVSQYQQAHSPAPPVHDRVTMTPLQQIPSRSQQPQQYQPGSGQFSPQSASPSSQVSPNSSQIQQYPAALGLVSLPTQAVPPATHTSSKSQQAYQYPSTPTNPPMPSSIGPSTFPGPPQPRPQSQRPTSSTYHDNRHSSSTTQSYASPPLNQNNSQYQQQPQPVETPGTQFYNTINDAGHKPSAHIQPQYADYLAAGSHSGSSPSNQPPAASTGTGAYSQYPYGSTNHQSPQSQFSPHQHQQQQQQQQHHHHHQQGSSIPPGAQQVPHYSNSNPYDVHTQVYQPTEAEHQRHHHDSSTSGHNRPSRTDTSSATGGTGGQSSSSRKSSRFDEGAARVEKGVGRLFKKIEKKIG